ncbi:MAG TPA: hypothetical protein PLU43_10560, partial [Lachnospiraceae bacterium]|nr:hypothetical protein [Lachnospiraceae bacterium]
VALTANAIKGIQEMFLENGFDDFLSKPIDIKRLGQIMYKWLPKEKQIDKDSYEEKVGTGTLDELLCRARAVFSKVSNFSVDSSLALCDNNIEIVLEVINIYVKSAKNVFLKIEKAYEQKDFHNYGIEVHGVKSASKNIGADLLSEEARMLEVESKAKNEVYVMTHHEQFLADYHRLVEELSESLKLIFPKETRKLKPISEEKYQSLLMNAKEALENWNTKDGMDMINELLSCELEEEARNSLEDILENIELFDFDIAIKKIRKLEGES